jgi:predicted aldo/keto reductase-like oxidoreductase
MFETAPALRTPADWALQWVWNQPEVSLALSGMSTMEQVVENVKSTDGSGPGTLRPGEIEFLKSLAAAYRALIAVPCTSCSYCIPCPQGINIPEIFGVYNEVIGFRRNEMMLKRGAAWYQRLPEAARPSACAECGECEQKCPQQIAIRKALKDIHKTLGADEPVTEGRRAITVE